MKFRREGPRLYGAAYRTYDKWAKPKSAGSSGMPYQTQLHPHQERHFRRWVRRNDIPFDVHARRVDYDMRGFWKAKRRGRPIATQSADHFPDRWKTPFDTSFSSESKYANRRNPLVWRGNRLVNSRSGRVFYKPRARQRVRRVS